MLGWGPELQGIPPHTMPCHILSQIAYFLKIIKSETGFLAAAPGGKMTAKSQNEAEFNDLILHGKHNPLNGI